MQRRKAGPDEIRIESKPCGFGRTGGEPLYTWHVVAVFNGVELRGNEYASEIAAKHDARQAFGMEGSVPLAPGT